MWVWAVSFACRSSPPRTAGVTAGAGGAASLVSRPPSPSSHPSPAISSSSRSWVRLPAAAKTQLPGRSEEHTSELQSLAYLVCRLLLEKKKQHKDPGIGPAVPTTRPTSHPATH